MQRPDQSAKALLQRDDCAGDLILEERIATARVNRFYSRRYYWVAGHREREPVDDDATELLALHVHSLPERRCSKKHGMGRDAKLLQQRGLRRVALLQHGKIQNAQQAVINFVHLRIAGKEYEGTAARDL